MCSRRLPSAALSCGVGQPPQLSVIERLHTNSGRMRPVYRRKDGIAGKEGEGRAAAMHNAQSSSVPGSTPWLASASIAIMCFAVPRKLFLGQQGETFAEFLQPQHMRGMPCRAFSRLPNHQVTQVPAQSTHTICWHPTTATCLLCPSLAMEGLLHEQYCALVQHHCTSAAPVRADHSSSQLHC